MRSIAILILSAFSVLSVFPQINRTHNAIRVGDVIIKQQVEYKDPGDAGANQIWDFSQLKTINKEYKLSYSSAPLQGDSLYILGDYSFKKKDVREDELVVGREHHTMYYYRVKEDSLLLLGYENVAVKQGYIQPFTQLIYPLSYGQKTITQYQAKGLYSGMAKVNSEGGSKMYADAFGTIILPSGDSINPVLRVQTVQTIFDTSKDVIKRLENDQGKRLISYKWYSKGYRYPIFETIQSIDLNNNKILFTTAFYYPRQEHLYIANDPENQKLLEEMWNMEDKNSTNQEVDKQAKTVTLEDIITCKIYPNPVESVLSLDYELKKDAKISFQLYTISGAPVKLATPRQRTAGSYSETIDCSSLQPRNYVLRITADSKYINEIIIKK